MKLTIINNSGNPVPEYKTSGSAGLDLQASIKDPVTLAMLDRKIIPTGIKVLDLPQGYEIQIRPRSGLAAKYGITVLNSPGTVDSDYQGEIGVILVNLSSVPYTIQPGERIAQMVVAKYETVSEFEVVSEDYDYKKTERAEGGFGHTGKH